MGDEYQSDPLKVYASFSELAKRAGAHVKNNRITIYHKEQGR